MIKVVWLCHFNNRRIEDKLGIQKSIEFAPWIDRFIDIFKNRKDIEIYIISPHKNINSFKTYNEGNIHYNFFPFMIPQIPKRILWLFHYITNFFLIKFFVKKIVNKINPDLIHMFGTENAYFTSSIFQFKKKYPVLISIQGFASHMLSNKYYSKKRKKVEIEIIKNFNNFGTRNKEMDEFLLSINKNIKFYYHEFAIYKPKYISSETTKKIYDIVFFARISKDKGIEDLIKAISKIKKNKKDIKVCVIGPGSTKYDNFLKTLSLNLGVKDNIDFIGALNTVDEVHNIAVQAKVSVLPSYYDTIPGTILESMLMKIPCIAYDVGGIPTLNSKNETILLVKKGDINELAKKILYLLNNKRKSDELTENAFHLVNSRWNDNDIYNSILDSYEKILIK